LVTEYADVLRREPLAAELTEAEREAFLDYFCSVGVLTEIFFLWRPSLKDPKDDMVLEVAVAAGAKLIITHNVKDFQETQRFGIEAITPKDYLQRKDRKP
jgi:predicted nucleic acid-binding protein